MYADMFAKIGQAIADIDETVQKNKKKKKEENKVTNQVEANFCPPGQNC